MPIDGMRVGIRIRNKKFHNILSFRLSFNLLQASQRHSNKIEHYFLFELITSRNEWVLVNMASL